MIDCFKNTRVRLATDDNLLRRHCQFAPDDKLLSNTIVKFAAGDDYLKKNSCGCFSRRRIVSKLVFKL